MATIAPATRIGAQKTPSQTLRRVTVAGAMGNFVEWYDYGIYGLLATYLAASIVGGADPSGILLTNAGFLVSFIARPFGSVVLGVLGDRLGRRRLLATTILLISASTVAIGVIPGYASIGVSAPILLILLRVLQGFSAGGEVAGAATYLAEYAPVRIRNRIVSSLQIGSFAALLSGSALSALLVTAVGEDGMTAWAWRLPFLLAAPIGIVGFVIRSRLDETPVYTEFTKKPNRPANPLRIALTSKQHLRAIATAIFLPALNGPGYYLLFAYMPTYLRTSLGDHNFSTVKALAVTAFGLVAVMAGIPAAARLSDRYGRKPVLAGSSVLMALVSYPAFLLITTGQFWCAAAGAVILALAFAGHAAVIHTALTEMFPTAIRYSAYSIGYSVSTIIFGGSAPLVMTAIANATGSSLIPAWASIVSAVISLLTIPFIRETRGTSMSA